MENLPNNLNNNKSSLSSDTIENVAPGSMRWLLDFLPTTLETSLGGSCGRGFPVPKRHEEATVGL